MGAGRSLPQARHQGPEDGLGDGVGHVGPLLGRLLGLRAVVGLKLAVVGVHLCLIGVALALLLVQDALAVGDLPRPRLPLGEQRFDRRVVAGELGPPLFLGQGQQVLLPPDVQVAPDVVRGALMRL